MDANLRMLGNHIECLVQSLHSISLTEMIIHVLLSLMSIDSVFYHDRSS